MGYRKDKIKRDFVVHFWRNKSLVSKYGMKRVLLAVQLETQFNELIRLARLLRDTNSCTVLFCFYDLTPLRFNRMRSACLAEGFDFILMNQEENELLQQGNVVVGSAPVHKETHIKRIRFFFLKFFL